VPRTWLDRANELVPTSTAWEIPGAAHSVMHAHAEEVARLCVVHAEGRSPADDELHVFPTPSDGEERRDDAPSFPAAVKAAAGRVTETIGILTDDDETIARGKTAHAEAMDGAPVDDAPVDSEGSGAGSGAGSR
jgi:hypothetical protein